MASVYTNDLRLEEIGSGEQSGTWGDTTNTNLELIAEGLSFGTEAITTNANTHTSTVADGASDPARSMYIKYTGALDSDCTITIAPNTLSRVHIIENATTDSGSSGPYNILISQGDGDAKVTIPSGHKKVVYLDGAGSGGVVVDAFTDLNVPSLFVKNPGTGDNSTALLTLQTAEADIAANDVLGKISFQAPDEGTGTDANLIAAAIQAISEGDFSSSSNATSLAFMTGASEAATTKFVIASDGSLSTPTLGTSNVRFGVNAGNSIESGGNFNVCVGDEAGTALTTGEGNTLIGGVAGDALTDANFNVAVGKNALSTDTLGSFNTAVGINALESQNFTTATNSFNTAVGSLAGGAVQSGQSNTLIGAQAGDAITTAGNNVGVGHNSLGTNILSSKNVALGTSALKTHNLATAGDAYNVAVGHQASENETTGTENTMVGAFAGGLGTLASKSVGVGYSALYRQNPTTAVDTHNIAIGYNTGSNILTGPENTLIGGFAGDALTTGNKNVVVGHNALGGGTTYDGNVAIGYEALFVADNTDGPDGNNIAIGSSSAVAVTSGIKNVMIGVSCAATLRTGADNILIGRQADVSAAGSANQITIGPAIACDQDSQVTIGKASNVVKLEFDTDATWTRSSDVRKKKNIENSTLGLDFVNDLRPVTFEWKPNNEFPKDFTEYSEKNNMTTGVTMHGMIAQEVKSALDNAEVDNFGGWKEDNDGSQRIAQDMFIYPLIKAMQELSAQVDTLKAEIKELKNGTVG